MKSIKKIINDQTLTFDFRKVVFWKETSSIISKPEAINLPNISALEIDLVLFLFKKLYIDFVGFIFEIILL